ncbi:MAG: DUF6526 family protein [Algoriphagus sp.]|jgi:hypothetical protein
MKNQNYGNHTRYNPFHHFILTPLTTVYFGWTIAKMDFSSQETILESAYLFIGAFVLVSLPLIARMYALTLQNRIIINEMRNRYFHLTGKTFEEKEQNLRLGQIIALRFASDEELLELMDRAIAEKLKAKEIKQQIKNWRGDYIRV